MADDTFDVENFAQKGGVVMPAMCQRHAHDLIVRKLHVPESATNPSWRVWMVIA